MATEALLELQGITKIFPGVKALDQVQLSVKRGEVHALLGENGAGKSTLMHILGGIYQPDAGQILLEGKPVKFKNGHDAQLAGISVVFQELSLVPNLSIAENIFANRQPTKLYFINRKKLYDETRELLRLFGEEHLDPATPVKFLPPAKQQVIEILKAISYRPKVLVLDEPTSSLTQLEVKKLFQNIRLLKEQGIAIIYISHHLHEVFEIADRVTVLRDGQYVATHPIGELTEEKIVRLMVGRNVSDMYGKRESPIGEVYFEVRDLTRKGVFEKVSFSLKKGEIVGIAGLVGAGRTEVGRAIFGAEPPDSGTILLEGRPLRIRSVKDAILQGIGYLTEDRKTQGLFLDMSVKMNHVAPSLSKFAGRLGFLKEKDMRDQTMEYVTLFKVATAGIEQKVGNLSGGNQQKILLSMWVGIRPKVLIVDEPTRGVDVGAKSEIYSQLRKLAAQGIGIIVISSDLPEILGLCDRVLVMRRGKLVAEFTSEEATEEKIISAATGIMG